MIGLLTCAFVAFSCEALAGFGGTVLALALGAQLRPIDELLAIFLPANLVLSAVLALGHTRAIDWRLLTRRIGPAMAIGLPFGLVLFRVLGNALRPVFAAIVILLAALEALRLVSRSTTRRPRLGMLLLWLAGVVHGAYGTGGPLVVFVAGRDLDDKHAIRATLAVLWLTLNLVLVAGFAVEGRLTGATLTSSLALLPVVAIALGLGERLAARLSDRPFRVFGAALLGVAGLSLLLRGA